MQLYVNTVSIPNPRRVLIFLKEKGIDVPLVKVDLAGKEHKSPAFTAMNPMQRVPVLVLDDGTPIAESVAICRYFEERQPDPPLFGRGAKEKALVEMWNRRVDHNLGAAVMAVFRHTHPAMAELEVPQIAEWAEVNRPRLLNVLSLLNDELAERTFIAGDSFSIADISAFCYIDFLRPTRVPIPEDHHHLLRWKTEMANRPSVS